MSLWKQEQNIKNILEGKSDMLGFKQFVAEDRRREGELLKDIQDLRKRTARLRSKDHYEAEKFKLQQQIKRRKER
tara:strand:- start:1381 stop:1605 length:225 start_codon:yes stop_codon:yes gene_type:complete